MAPPRDTNDTTNDIDRVREPIVSPYMPKYPDPMSNVSKFKIIESTLRGKKSKNPFHLSHAYMNSLHFILTYRG
jgi:homocitrate synthase